MAGVGPFSSSSSTRVDTRNTAYSTGFSEIGGPAQSVNLDLGGKVKVGKGGTVAPVINLTDQGAVNAALDVASKSIKSVELFGGNVTSLIEGITAALADSGDRVVAAIGEANKVSIGAVSEANRTELENLGLAAIKWGALALAAYLAARAVWSMAK